MKQSIKILLGSAFLSVSIINLTLNQTLKKNVSLAFSDIEYIAYGQEGSGNENITNDNPPYYPLANQAYPKSVCTYNSGNSSGETNQDASEKTRNVQAGASATASWGGNGGSGNASYNGEKTSSNTNSQTQSQNYATSISVTTYVRDCVGDKGSHCTPSYF